MAYYPVDFFVADALKAPIQGVVLRVYSEDGKVFYTETRTDETGHGGFLLDDSVSYQLRVYKFSVSFTNPLRFQVSSPSPPAVNKFEIYGELFTPPVALDPRLCRVSGFFRRGDGASASYVDMHVLPKFRPLLLESAGVLPEKTLIRTNARGFVEIDLIRFGQYDVTIQGMEPVFRTISVPDAPSANFPDLLFPVVRQVTFSPAGPWTIYAGTATNVTPTITASNGEILKGIGIGDVVWSTADPSIAAVVDDGVTLTLRAFKSGTTTLIARRYDTSIIRIPDPGIIGTPVPITVP